MKVRATEMYKKLNLQDNELKRIPEVGEEWEVTEERFKVLTETNTYGVAFVKRVIIEDEVEIAEEDIIDGKDLKDDEVIDVKADKVNVTKNKTTRKKK